MTSGGPSGALVRGIAAKMAPRRALLLRVFVAFPGDCLAERKAVHRMITKNPAIIAECRNKGFAIQDCDYKQVPPALGRPQSIINAAVERFNPDWIIFIFKHRLGDDAGLGMTGMEEEWEIARRRHEEGGGRPSVSLYFCDRKPSGHLGDPSQYRSLITFRETIFKGHQALACLYGGTGDFEEKFQGHLMDQLWELENASTSASSSGPVVLRKEFLTASQGLLNWPRTLGNKHEITRPELRQLTEIIYQKESSATLVLGPPGSGKSALLAALGHQLLDEGIALLAIKADMLGAHVNSLEELQKWVGTSIDVRVGFRALAESERVVLLLDQLDAVSELLDRRSGRLNVLLNLMQSLASTKNIHIVATSREFELRHDVRLTSLSAQDRIERIDLGPPAWDQISPVLAQAGHEPDRMSDDLRKLLQVPLHLKIFLDLADPHRDFGSLQALLGRLWEERVTDPQAPHNRETLLQELAQMMARDEVLWLPNAVADRHPGARAALERADILAPGPAVGTIGFRHQTYYDYTLARTFAAGASSLTAHVRARQDGLFVRPTLLSGLHFLRGNARPQYHRELRALLRSGPRYHIKRLVLEFLGGQKEPDDVEASVLLPLLASDADGPRVLADVAGSPGWYERLRQHPQLRRWMRKPPQQAIYCLRFLSEAVRFRQADVLRLLKEHWLINPSLDHLSLQVLRDLEEWDDQTCEMTCQIARRTYDWSITLLAENAAKKNASLAPRIIRADLERRFQESYAEMRKRRRQSRRITSRRQRFIQTVRRPDHAPLEELIRDSKAWFEIDKFAKAAPRAFLDQLWPWFLRTVQLLAEREHPFVIMYRQDSASRLAFDRELSSHSIPHALWVALSELVAVERQAFLQFAADNERSDFMVVHLLLARGFERLATHEPRAALKYLLTDPRRLVIGDDFGETRRLITALCPHLSPGERQELERRIINLQRYKRILRKWSPRERLQRLKWTREERLRLLRAFPEQYLSAATRRLRAEEEIALPGTSDYHTRGDFGAVGARVTASEMSRASDRDLLRLFDELHDGTKWDNPKRIWSKGVKRAGGSIQQSREFAELAKTQRERVLRLLPQLKPGQHEDYVAAAFFALSESDFPTAELFALIMQCHQRGFTSPDFRETVARALEKCARRDHGLPDEALKLLEDWLEVHTEPSSSARRKQSKDADRKDGPILFGMGGIVYMPPGRGFLMEAIATGYLHRQKPDLGGWARTIEYRVGKERHPAVWGVAMKYMPKLFNGDPTRATTLYDRVIRACPDVLREDFAIFAVARILGRCRPRTVAEDWLKALQRDNSLFCQQAYAELLFLYHGIHQDGWSKARIRRHLGSRRAVAIQRGLAFAARSLYDDERCRRIATEVLCRLASHPNKSVQDAVGTVFHIQRDHFDLSGPTKTIIKVFCKNPPVLLRALPDLLQLLEPFAATEPAVVAQTCKISLRTTGREIGNLATGMVRAAQPLTNIALTLHRQPRYRKVGLELFEDLMKLRINEARMALDLLDRKPLTQSRG